ncbi:MAG: hypothetical protein U9Q73_00150 [Nanoarchaeota archaeon]|nr:hypothetical protein [Nanoarchaeota archaeon]
MKNNNRIITFENSDVISENLNRIDTKNELGEKFKQLPFDYKGFQEGLTYITEKDVNIVAVIASSGLELRIKNLHERLNEKGVSPYPSKERNLYIDIEMESFHDYFPQNDALHFYDKLGGKFPEAEKMYISSYTSCLIDPAAYSDNKLLENPFSDSRVIYYPISGGSIHKNPVCSLLLGVTNKYFTKD